MALAEPLVAELGLEILEIELAGEASRRIVRILLDGERPVTLADCEAVSRRLGDVLDAHEDETGGAGGRSGRYMLEVSSPGVNRPLVKPAHFVRAVGSRVRLKLAEQGPVRSLRGRLVEADENGLTVTTDEGETRALAHDEVERAHVEYEFPETRKPGGQGAKGKKTGASRKRR